MGEAFGLFIKESGLKAVFISPRPLPDSLQYLDWEWETEQNLSKLLGFHVGTDISPQRLSQAILEALES